jgi:hypothetical protein
VTIPSRISIGSVDKLKPLVRHPSTKGCNVASRCAFGRALSTPTLAVTENDLRLRCKPVWIEAIGGPRKIVAHAVETHAKQMLDRLCCAPPGPARRLVGAGDRWQAAAVLLDLAEREIRRHRQKKLSARFL